MDLIILKKNNNVNYLKKNMTRWNESLNID